MTQAEEVLELIKRKINLGEHDLQIIEEVLSNPFKEYLKREAISRLEEKDIEPNYYNIALAMKAIEWVISDNSDTIDEAISEKLRS